jgi:predicted esterase
MRATFALLAVLAACAAAQPGDKGIGRSEPASADSDSPAVASSAPSPRASDDPPASSAPSELEVPGFGAALVVLPETRARPAPLLVAAHGAGDAPEWQCDHWGKVARGRYFVLCPRGLSLGGGGYYYATHIALERELVAALDAVRREYGAMVLRGGGIYTGYSQGATMGALMIVEHGAELSHLVLVEGGWGDWTLGRAKRYAATGGKSVALVCGSTGCMHRAEAAVKVLERAGLRARAELVEGGGHTYVGPVGERATELFESWLLGER